MLDELLVQSTGTLHKRRNLRDILELDGYQVAGASTLKEATDRHAWSDHSIILLDRKLPDGIADAVLPQIKEAAPRTAVIIVTGYADLDGTIAALRSGAADYLLKPINPELLRAAITRVLKMQDMEERVLQSERLAAIGQMITVLTHESGNALGRSQVLLETLAEEVQGQPEAIELIGRLQKAQVDLRRLYEDVRNYAAPMELERELWGLSSIWRQAWTNLMVTRNDKKGASLIEQNTGVDLTCEVDNFRLDQVFCNLFGNSLSACPDPARVEVICSDAVLNSPLKYSEPHQNAYKNRWKNSSLWSVSGYFNRLLMADRLFVCVFGITAPASRLTNRRRFSIPFTRRSKKEQALAWQSSNESSRPMAETLSLAANSHREQNS